MPSWQLVLSTATAKGFPNTGLTAAKARARQNSIQGKEEMSPRTWGWPGWAMAPGAQRGQMAPGARSKFGAPVVETEVLRKQMHCIEESVCDIVGTFWSPRSDLASP